MQLFPPRHYRLKPRVDLIRDTQFTNHPFPILIEPSISHLYFFQTHYVHPQKVINAKYLYFKWRQIVNLRQEVEDQYRECVKPLFPKWKNTYIVPYQIVIKDYRMRRLKKFELDETSWRNCVKIEHVGDMLEFLTDYPTIRKALVISSILRRLNKLELTYFNLLYQLITLWKKPSTYPYWYLAVYAGTLVLNDKDKVHDITETIDNLVYPIDWYFDSRQSHQPRPTEGSQSSC